VNRPRLSLLQRGTNDAGDSLPPGIGEGKGKNQSFHSERQGRILTLNRTAQGALRRWTSQKYGAGKLRFPHATEFAHAFQMICQPSSRPKVSSMPVGGGTKLLACQGHPHVSGRPLQVYIMDEIEFVYLSLVKTFIYYIYLKCPWPCRIIT